MTGGSYAEEVLGTSPKQLLGHLGAGSGFGLNLLRVVMNEAW